jgi:hypothetical protein
VYKDLSDLLMEAFGGIFLNSRAEGTSQAVYLEFTSTLHHPKFEDHLPDLPRRIA